jgi:hypothetical protein
VVAGGGPWCGGSPQALKTPAVLASDKTTVIEATERIRRPPESVDDRIYNSTVRYRIPSTHEVKL